MFLRIIRYRSIVSAPLIALMGAVALFISGCPILEGQQAEEAHLAVLLTADSFLSQKDTLAEKERIVPVAEIESLVVTVVGIELEQDAAGGGSEMVAVVSDAFDVDLVDAVGISEVLELLDFSAGYYSAIRLTLSTPRLTLVASPDTVITDVQLPGDGVLTITMAHELMGGERSSLLVNMGALSLTELDDGSYLLSSAVGVTLDDTITTAKMVGVIQGLNQEANTFELRSGHMGIDVDYTDAVVFLSDDAEAPTGTEQDLAEDAVVVVLGTLSADHVLIAEVIAIRSFDAADHVHGQDVGNRQDLPFHDMLDNYGGHYGDDGSHMGDYGDHHDSEDDSDNGQNSSRGHGEMM